MTSELYVIVFSCVFFSAISFVSIMVAVLAYSEAMKAKAEVVGFKNSTHQVQMVPMEFFKDKAKEISSDDSETSEDTSEDVSEDTVDKFVGDPEYFTRDQIDSLQMKFKQEDARINKAKAPREFLALGDELDQEQL